MSAKDCCSNKSDIVHDFAGVVIIIIVGSGTIDLQRDLHEFITTTNVGVVNVVVIISTLRSWGAGDIHVFGGRDRIALDSCSKPCSLSR